MPALRRNAPSVRPGCMIGTSGMPGQNSAVTFSMVRIRSGLSGDGGLSVCVLSSVTET